MISNRDFVSQRTYAENYKGYNYVVSATGVEHPSKPPVKGIVRGHVMTAGHGIKALEGGKKSQIQMCLHVDIKVRKPFNPIGRYSEDDCELSGWKGSKEVVQDLR